MASFFTQEFLTNLPKVLTEKQKSTDPHFESRDFKVIFDNFCITPMACHWSSRWIWCTASCILVECGKWKHDGKQMSIVSGFLRWWNKWFNQIVYITSLTFMFIHLPNYLITDVFWPIWLGPGIQTQWPASRIGISVVPVFQFNDSSWFAILPSCNAERPKVLQDALANIIEGITKVVPRFNESYNGWFSKKPRLKDPRFVRIFTGEIILISRGVTWEKVNPPSGWCQDVRFF